MAAGGERLSLELRRSFWAAAGHCGERRVSSAEATTQAYDLLSFPATGRTTSSSAGLMHPLPYAADPALLRPVLLHLEPTAPTIFPVAGVKRAPHSTILGMNEPHIPPSPHNLPGGRWKAHVVVSNSSHSWSLSKTLQRRRHAASEKYRQQATSSSNLGISQCLLQGSCKLLFSLLVILFFYISYFLLL